MAKTNKTKPAQNQPLNQKFQEQRKLSPHAKMKIANNKFSDSFKAKAKSRLELWKQKQELLKITTTASTSGTAAQTANGPPKMSRTKLKYCRRYKRRNPSNSQLQIHNKFVQSTKTHTVYNDSDDSDVEIIENKPTIVVLDDEEESSSDESVSHTRPVEQVGEVSAEEKVQEAEEEPAEKAVTVEEPVAELATNESHETVEAVGAEEECANIPSTSPAAEEPPTEEIQTPEVEQPKEPEDANDTFESQDSAGLVDSTGYLSSSLNNIETDADVLALKKAIEDHSGNSKELFESPSIPAASADASDTGCSTITNTAVASTSSVIAEPPQITSTPIKPGMLWTDLFKSPPNTPSAAQLVDGGGVPLFFEDKNSSIDNAVIAHVPLYDAISDDSFVCAEQTLTPQRPVASYSGIRKTAAMEIVNLVDANATRSPRNARKRKRPAPDADDSVIFVSETIAASEATLSRAAVNFISINNKSKKVNSNQAKNFNNNASKPAPKLRVFQRTVANTPATASTIPTVASTIPSVANNTYNPSKLDVSKTTKRMVIIDGSNVAYSHSTNHTFSVRGLAICIEFFEREGHVVKAVLPQMRLKQHMSTDPVLLESLHNKGKVVLTPCKNLPGKNTTSYDDRFIMDLAAEFDAAVISNDNYRDLFMENEMKYRKIIESRVIGYTWCMDMILFPKDPYGRDGPSLDDILNRKC